MSISQVLYFLFKKIASEYQIKNVYCDILGKKRLTLIVLTCVSTRFKILISVFQKRNSYLYVGTPHDDEDKGNFEWFNDVPRAMQT